VSKKDSSLAADPADLVAEVIQANAEAQDAWFRIEFPVVFRLCLGFLADHAAADDLAQDAMIRLIDRLDRWDSQRPYQAWRTAVVLNLCRDHLRSAGRRRRAEGHLRLVEQQPTDVVATAMDVTPATVRSLLTLARRRLRGILAPALAMDSKAAGGGNV